MYKARFTQQSNSIFDIEHYYHGRLKNLVEAIFNIAHHYQSWQLKNLVDAMRNKQRIKLNCGWIAQLVRVPD